MFIVVSENATISVTQGFGKYPVPAKIPSDRGGADSLTAKSRFDPGESRQVKG
jgi:hypothetical protein